MRLARDRFLAGERVDMQALAADLGVGRTTLYRWVGDRERLIGEILGDLTDLGWRAAVSGAQGEGLERTLAAIRWFMMITADFPPLRFFARREPEAALRVLMSRRGVVAERLMDGVRRSIELGGVAAPDPEVVDVIVQIGTTLEWANVATGQEADIERAISTIRLLLRASLR